MVQRRLATMLIVLLCAQQGSPFFLELAAGLGAVVAAPFVLPAIGFGAGGIAAGSWGASMMSTAAIANGGGVASVAAGGVIAALQSAGAAGIGVAGNAALAGAGAATARAAKKVFSEDEDQCP